MSIGLTTVCLSCHFNKNVQKARAMGDEQTATAFAKDLMRLYLAAPDYASSPYFSDGVEELYRKHYGLTADRFAEEKRESNVFALSQLPRVERIVDAQADPVLAALKFAIQGNYIDYSALGNEVSMEVLAGMLDEALAMELPMDTYERMCRDLRHAKTLLVLTDNAGEIAFDRILGEKLQEQYPGLAITFCVRGGNVLNDATREDAAMVGIPFPVIDSGTPTAGTVPERLGETAKAAFESADVILSKGMGNTETLYGCGKNVYYAFLIKCQWFMQLFDKPKFTPMLVRELDAGKLTGA